MEHNVITHPGGWQSSKGFTEVSLSPIDDSPSLVCSHSVLVSFCSCSCCYCYFLNLFRIVNSIILTFYCIFIAFVTSLNVFMTLLCRFFVFCCSTLGRVLYKHLEDASYYLEGSRGNSDLSSGIGSIMYLVDEVGGNTLVCRQMRFQIVGMFFSLFLILSHNGTNQVPDLVL